jgi:hypothetical protein
LARAKPAVLELLGRDGFIELLGADRIHDGIQQAVTAQQGAEPDSAS